MLKEERNTDSQFLFNIKNGQIIAIVIDDTNPCRSILEGLLEPSHPLEKEVADEAVALFLSSFLGDTCLWNENPLSFVSISCCFYHRTKEENKEMCWNLTCVRYVLLLRLKNAKVQNRTCCQYFILPWSIVILIKQLNVPSI